MSLKPKNGHETSITAHPPSKVLIDWDEMVAAVRGLRAEFKEAWFKIGKGDQPASPFTLI